MQIAMVSFYEAEKRANKGKNLSELFHQKYKLNKTYYHSKIDYTSYAISDSEEVLLYLNFCTSGTLEDGAYGNSFYDFYICKNQDCYYLKCFNTIHLDVIARQCGNKLTKRLGYFIGTRATEYKKYLINNAMRAIIELDGNDVERILDRLKHTPSDECENCTANGYSKTSVELFDFVNNGSFLADDYVLPKYECYVEAIQYIIDKSEMAWLKDVGLQYVDGVEEAWDKYIDKHLRDEYMIYGDDLKDGEIISCYIGE